MRARFCCFPSVFLLAFVLSVEAEQVPIRSYTPENGLPSSFIHHILRDSHGYLWFSTRNGLAKFDGYQFVNYGMEHGLSHSTVNYVLETRRGNYWVATNGGGLCRFFPNGDPDARGRSLFRCYPVGKTAETNRVNYLLEDHSGNLWAGTDGGVFMMKSGESRLRDFSLSSLKEFSGYAYATVALVEDNWHTLWIRTDQAGLFRVLPDGAIQRYPGWYGDTSYGALLDHSGQIWMSTVDGVRIIRTVNNTTISNEPKNFAPVNELGSKNVRSLLQTSDGLIWFAMDNGLSCFDGKTFREYTTADGLISNSLSALAEDNDGNVWIGTLGKGVMKLLRKGFVSYNQSSLGDFGPVHSIARSSEGQIYVISGDWLIHAFQKETFSSIRMPVPLNFTHLWDSNVALIDSRGEWWGASAQGLLRFPTVRSLADLRKSRPHLYTVKDGLPGNMILRIYEDSSGDLWISSKNAVRYRLARWDHRTDRFYQFSEKEHVFVNETATAFLDDRKGNVWIGYANDRGLLRYRNRVFQQFSSDDGLPRGMITTLYSDHSGRLWIATNYGGIARVDQPSAEKLHFAIYTKNNGLSANDCRAITEDREGRIYIGTVHGIDQLNPVTGQIHRYTMADGLSSDFITAAYSDRGGELWFGTYAGISRLKDQPDFSAKSLQVLLTSVSLAGTPYPLSELGVPSVSGIRLPSNRNQIQVSFGAINFSLGENLRFQYRLDGMDEDWNMPVTERSVRYGGLSPGRYRFVVRALDESRVISASPALVEFVIVKPVWLQWWFLSLSVAFVVLLIHSIYRIRTKRLIEIERLRTRIASDLHDDIGSSLSRIAILSDTVRRKLHQENGVTSLLLTVAEASRDAIDAMGDIVWVVNPRKDQLHDLESRMRRLAGEMLSERTMNFDFSPNAMQENLILNPDLKRNIFLIYKECLHNVVRHSDASAVHIRLQVLGKSLLLEVRDNGKGFNASQTFEGQGLRNMMKRASELNGVLEISSQPGEGSIIRFRTSFHRSHLFSA